MSRSSCESEYRALSNTASEIIWVTHLLRELHVLPSGRPTLLCDNRDALFLSQNLISHKREKHIDIDYHSVQEWVLSGKLHTRYNSTHLQLADIFTKSLPRPFFEEFRSKLQNLTLHSYVNVVNRGVIQSATFMYLVAPSTPEFLDVLELKITLKPITSSEGISKTVNQHILEASQRASLKP
ncbi:uncharacterized mitochondrial protein-like protein [Tanacetum coccineum]|uniref:Uncharacterized mitochondrial protein-like protein n=1 Tax=Tanacetum coccineum TaxID=301880 RepID=A0ABQ5EKJ6_9ASTR